MADGGPNNKWIFKFCTEYGSIYSFINSHSAELRRCLSNQEDSCYYSVCDIPA